MFLLIEINPPLSLLVLFLEQNIADLHKCIKVILS